MIAMIVTSPTSAFVGQVIVATVVMHILSIENDFITLIYSGASILHLLTISIGQEPCPKIV